MQVDAQYRHTMLAMGLVQPVQQTCVGDSGMAPVRQREPTQAAPALAMDVRNDIGTQPAQGSDLNIDPHVEQSYVTAVRDWEQCTAVREQHYDAQLLGSQARFGGNRPVWLSLAWLACAVVLALSGIVMRLQHSVHVAAYGVLTIAAAGISVMALAETAAFYSMIAHAQR